MLEYLRNAAEKPVAKILIGLLAFSFVGWGVAEWIFGGTASDTTLVSVGDRDITINEFNIEKSRQLSMLSRDAQRDIYADAAAMRALDQQVLGTLATQAMVENRADDLGFVVSDAQIAREITLFPEFQMNGQFSTYLFDTILTRTGYSEAAFANVLRGQLLRGYVLAPVSVPISVPDFAVRAAYDARYATRQIEYATVKYSDFSVDEPTVEQLRAFYEQNPHTVPEQRTVSYVLVAADMDKPDEYDAAYQQAILVEDDIIAGETMATAAKNHGAKYVALGTFDAANRPADVILTDSMMANIFDMEEGLESELMETRHGFVIVRVDQVIPTHNAEFESVQDDLVDAWKRAEQRKQAYVRANEILVDLNDGNQMDGGKTVTVSRAQGAPVDVLSAAFNSQIGSNSIVDGTDAFYVLHVDHEIMPDVDDAKIADIRKELENIATQGISDDYNTFLGREYPVEINDKVYNRFFAR